MEILTWQARTRKNLTLKQLSAMTGLSKTTLNDIENGKVSPTLRELELIAKALEVKMSDLYESVYKYYNSKTDTHNRISKYFRYYGNNQYNYLSYSSIMLR